MTIPSQTEIVLTITPSALPRPDVWSGQGMRVAMQVRDPATLAPVAASGIVVLVLRPGDAVPTTYAQSELTADGDGRWVLDLATDAGGAWRVRAECTAPRPAATEARFDVRGSAVVQPDPPDVLLATPDGEVLGTPDGAALTARRTDRLAAAGTPMAEDSLVVVRGGVPLRQSWDNLSGETLAARDEAEVARAAALGSQVAAAASANTASDAAAVISSTIPNAATPAATLAELTTAMSALPDGSLGVVYTGSEAGHYRKLAGVLVKESRTIPQIDASEAATPARVRSSSISGTLVEWLDRKRRRFASIDQAGARLVVAGQTLARISATVFRWQPLAGGVKLDLRADGIETDGPRVKFGGTALRSATSASIGGYTDQLSAVDSRYKTWFRLGFRHLMLGKFRVEQPAATDRIVISGAGGVMMREEASGRVEVPRGRISYQAASTGIVLIIQHARYKVSRFRIHPALGVLYLDGKDPTGGSTIGDFTAAEVAACVKNARDYSSRVRRRVPALRKPSAQIEQVAGYGQSLLQGARGVPTLTRTALYYNNLMLGLSVHAQRESFSAWLPIADSVLRPLVAAAPNASIPATGVLTPEEMAAGQGDRGETYLVGFAAVLRAAWLASRGEVDNDSTQFLYTVAGVGGTTIAELTGTAPNYFNRFKEALLAGRAAATAAGKTHGVAAIVFDQGQSDSSLGTPYADYISTATTLFTNMRDFITTDLGQTGLVPIYIVQTSGQFIGSAGDSSGLAVLRAQAELARTIPGVFLVGGTSMVPDAAGSHLTANGTRWIGCQIGKVAARTLIRGEGWEPARVIRWIVRGQTLIGEVHCPDGDLMVAPAWVARTLSPLVDAAGKGIYVTDSSGVVAVTDVAFVDGCLIRASLERAVTGAVEVTLGRYGDSMLGSIVLAVRSAEVLPYAYEYNAGSGQSTDENIAALVGLRYPADDYLIADVQTAATTV